MRSVRLLVCTLSVTLVFASSSADATDTDSEPSAPIPAISIQPPGHIQPLRFGMLVTGDLIVGPRGATDEGRDVGFAVSDARLLVAGELEGGFGYLVQGLLISSPPLLDAIIDWKSTRSGTKISAGYFRTPFSGEVLIAAPQLDFVDRSQIIRAIAPVRQVGVQLDQELLGPALVAKFGLFNGNGLNSNDDERFLYVGRLDGVAQAGHEDELRFVYGVNFAYSEDDDADLGFGLPRNFAGKRWLAGGDIRFERGPLFLSAEALYGRIDPNGSGARNVYGYQTSIGIHVHPQVQILARYDALYAASFRSDRDLAIASVVVDFTKYVNIQGELRVPARGEDPTPGGIINLNVQF